ncbi:MAG TPA: hypothetical protein VF897_09435 [Roseiflexaceae bacterium]
MPVIINDLEVIAPPEPPEKQHETKPQNQAPPGPTPDDLYQVLRRLIARQLRVEAD